MWGDMSWESYHDIEGNPNNSMQNDENMGDQLTGHPDVKYIKRQGLLYSIQRWIIKFFQ
jgi:hypothetical protein